MSDPNWISAANTHHPASVLGKSRTDFGVETSSRSPHFCRAINATVPRPQLCELDDHILQDIGLTREALLRETTRPFWR